jgi:hypothetical protein
LATTLDPPEVVSSGNRELAKMVDRDGVPLRSSTFRMNSGVVVRARA